MQCGLPAACHNRHAFHPAISVCWFSAPDPGSLQAFDGRKILAPANVPENFDSREFITFSLVGPLEDSEYFALQSTEDAVDEIMKLPVIIERSPPQAVRLTHLLSKKTAAPTIGLFLGYNLAAGNYPLMLFAVPFGIVLIGAAVGVSEGLQKGLARKIEQLIMPKRKS